MFVLPPVIKSPYKISESLKEDKSKRYKIAFAKDSPKDAYLTFKTGMIVDAKSLNRKTVIK